MQRQPEFPHFLCGGFLPSLSSLNLSRWDWKNLGRVGVCDNIKHLQYMGREVNKSRCQHISKGFYLTLEPMQSSSGSTINCSKLVMEGCHSVPAWWHYEVESLFSKYSRQLTSSVSTLYMCDDYSKQSSLSHPNFRSCSCKRQYFWGKTPEVKVNVDSQFCWY